MHTSESSFFNRKHPCAPFCVSANEKSAFCIGPAFLKPVVAVCLCLAAVKNVWHMSQFPHLFIVLHHNGLILFALVQVLRLTERSMYN
jgi:hypothetical protein